LHFNAYFSLCNHSKFVAVGFIFDIDLTKSDMNDISKSNDLKSDSDSSELTNDTNSNILPVNDDKNIGVYVQEEIPKKRKKYKPRKNNNNEKRYFQ
jgi:hypothetical protein